MYLMGMYSWRRILTMQLQFFQKILLLVLPMATLLVGLGRRLAGFQAEPSLLAVGTALSWLRSYIEQVKKLHNFFHKYTGFTVTGHASCILSIFYLQATSGASDAAKESVICGTIKALMHQIGFDKFITHEQLACAFLGNWEL